MNRERAEFQLAGAQWPTDDNTLTYSFVGSGSLGLFTDENRWEVLSRTPFGEDPFDPIDFRAAFREAVSAWEDVCGVDLVEVADGADVDIRVGWQRFASGHSDGPGGTLGVANWWFTPAGIRTEATITFDPQDFRFPSLGPGAAGSDPDAFYDTALHEIGHALGISHSNVANVVMSGPPETQYWGGTPGRDQLQPDDVAAARAIWGAPGHRPTPTPDSPHYDNVIVGTPGVDRLYGGSGNDVLTGGAGRDLLAGGDGDDLLLGGHEGATLFGQGGADTFVYTGGRNWFMDFDAAQGDRIAGVSQAYLEAEGQTQQVGEHLAIYFGESPWDADGPGTIWLAHTMGLPDGDFLA